MFMAGNLEVSPDFATLLQETSTLLWSVAISPDGFFGPKRFPDDAPFHPNKPNPTDWATTMAPL